MPDDRTNLNAQFISEIQTVIGIDTTSYNFAVIADPHFYYDFTKDVLDRIKEDPTIRFVIVNGDLTDQAQMEEFQLYSEVMMESGLPFISVIGNHDHLANGRQTYQEMFGERNFAFTIGGVRYILFDNTEFESEITVDYPWLEAKLNEPFSGQTLVFMHIHPTDGQMTGQPLHTLETIMANNKPDDVYMGHLHKYDSRRFPDGTRWTTAPWPRRMGYLKVFVTPDTSFHQLIEF